MVNNPLGVTQKHFISIYVIGAGGTGSQVLQQLGRVHCALKAQNKPGIVVQLFDGDRVTDANMARQLFAPIEVGRFKADALIERMNRFYGTDWVAVPKMVTMKEIANANICANIIITCVDNAEARIAMHDNIVNVLPLEQRTHDGFKNHYWIDTGNAKTTGQIILGSYKHNIPTVIDMFPDIKKYEDKDDTPSCSLAEALDRQHLFINTIVGQVTGMLVLDICTKPVLTWFGAYINLEAPTMINKRIGREKQGKGKDSNTGRPHAANKKAKGVGSRSKRAATR